MTTEDKMAEQSLVTENEKLKQIIAVMIQERETLVKYIALLHQSNPIKLLGDNGKLLKI